MGLVTYTGELLATWRSAKAWCGGASGSSVPVPVAARYIIPGGIWGLGMPVNACWI